MVCQHLADQGAVADIACHERYIVGHEGADAGGEIVENDDAVAGFTQREHRMAADIPGAAGDKDGGLRHGGRQPSRSEVGRHRRPVAAGAELHAALEDERHVHT